MRKASFGEAATELGASPAYVSKRIRLLEQELGVKLLHRTTRRVAVTEEGERVFQWAQRILDDMDQLLQEVAVTRREPQGQLRSEQQFWLWPADRGPRHVPAGRAACRLAGPAGSV